MSEVKKDYTPLPELESPKFRFAVTLPNFVDPRSIGINLKRVGLLCRLGGIGHLRVENLTDQDTSSYVPIIAGFDAKGNAYAAKTGLKTSVPPYAVDSHADGGSLLATRWVNGVIKINTDETANRILSEPRWNNGVNTPDAWAYHLNRSIRGGIEDIGTKHLVLGVNKTDLFYELFVVAQIVLNKIVLNNPLIIYGSWCLWFNVVMPLAYVNFRRSLFIYGPQLDRALLLRLISSRSTLVKSIMVPPWPTTR